MLELDDIQHFLLTRPRALAARYGFLCFRQPDQGAPGCPASSTVSVAAARSNPGARSIRAGSPSRSPGTGCGHSASTTPALATFPDEFRQGMAARASILGDTGANHPDHWVGGLASPDLHAIVILFARDVPERERCVREHQQYAAQFPGSKRSRHSISRPLRRSTMRTIISDIAIACRSPRSRAWASSRRPAPARRSSLASSFSGIPMKTATPAHCPSPTSWRGTAAFSPIARWTSMSAPSATSCERTAPRPRSRN